MPDLARRAAFERKLSRGIGRALARQHRAILAGERVQWDRLTIDVAAALRETLSAVFEKSFLRLLTPTTGSADLLSQSWAQARAVELADALAKNMRAELAAGRDPAKVFSSGRAEVMAATEVTAAVSSAELAARVEDARETALSGEPTPEEETADDGLGVTDDKRAIWVTERDAKVCPICAPLNLRPENEWADQFPLGPPAHPNCRCHLELIPRKWDWRKWARRRLPG